MPFFKKSDSSKVIEVTEEFAEQVLRRQGQYVEVDAPEKVVAPSKKKIVRKKMKGDK